MENTDSARPQNKIIPAYFDHFGRCYWVCDGREDFITVSAQDLRLRLRQAGISIKQPDNKPLSPLEEAILEIQQNHNVSYAASLAGYDKGLHIISGQRILVIDSPVLIHPKQGEWPVLGQLLKNLFGEQVIFFYGWMKHAIECLRSKRRAPGQALVIVGEHAAGKSLIQNVITLLLGGRSQKPYRYMAGETTFNSELFKAEHLTIEDETASRDLRTRKKFGAQIKAMLASETQSCHAKSRTAVNLTPFWRLTISLNTEPESLLTLPPMDNSMEDKLILFNAAKRPMPMPTSSLDERVAFMAKLKSELPAFIDFLLNWTIPDNLKSERFAITHYHDPVLRQQIETLAPEMRLLEITDATVFIGRKDDWTGTAADLEGELSSSVKSREARAVLNFTSAAGTYLGRLALNNPKRVEKLTSGAGNRWRIHPPAE